LLTFNCPKCKLFCAVTEKYAGRRVRCTHCASRFIVPAKAGLQPTLCKDIPEPPLPQFYRVIFLRNWIGLIQKDSLVGLVFCIIMPCFQFFIGNLDYSIYMPGFNLLMPIGWITQFITLASLSWYFFHTIGCTYLYPDTLPEVDIGFGFEYFGNLFKSLYLFIVAVLLAMMPAMIIGRLLESSPLLVTGVRVGLFIFSCFFLALFLALFGMELPTWIVFRIDLLARAVIKTFRPYIVTALITMFAFAVWLGSLTTFNDNKEMSLVKTGLYLAWRIAGVILMLYAMRTIGFYCRHYARTYPPLWTMRQD
jgi:DNA-directed RNA polymerase subunit RPC12/RpoP